MSQRLQMLQVARLARRTLGDAIGLVIDFVRGTAAPGGGHVDRAGRRDRYYTAFATDALVALDALDPADPHLALTRRWLEGYGDGDGLDLVHRACLVRAWAAQPPGSLAERTREAIAAGFAPHRAADGGYASRRGAARGTAYGAFLVKNAHDDLRLPLPDPAALADAVAALTSADGGFSNEPGRAEGSTTATAAAVATLRALDRPVPAGIADWFLARWHPAGGFVAAPDAPLPDLLSTAVALHALDALDVPWRDRREALLDFLDSLWTNTGAFHGSWADDEPDVEYTFYGLVALGHASV
ncbi:MAG: prenyltransferase/squalene oxidase repeat-containing protein [Planctomycetaceae bacterium]